MNSLNHYSYGSVVEFLYRYAVGISPLEPGFRVAKIAPVPEIRLGNVNCRFDSAAGQYHVQWKIQKDGSLYFCIEIPFGCQAEVHLPEQDSQILSAGHYEASTSAHSTVANPQHEDQPAISHCFDYQSDSDVIVIPF